VTGYRSPDRLVIGIDPDHLALGLNVNGPDDPTTLSQLQLDADLCPGRLPPYGQVLEAILAGDPMLSVRGDTTVECWRIVDPVRQAWRDDTVPLEEYPAGTRPRDRIIDAG
jgi:glucose-6-phosphate 1-dehydrogenase